MQGHEHELGRSADTIQTQQVQPYQNYTPVLRKWLMSLLSAKFIKSVCSITSEIIELSHNLYN
ncbi:Uncharacterized protein dnm_071510 [Desulfonema magnum]|uniref:Uncharacterized protein n=1 Tax=Desulfonema magnum TaxID=45655 RepID=A0A975BSY4_9BACT|nr:Uncharacterized protein dnm_071510 [Desulfonema magnum]